MQRMPLFIFGLGLAVITPISSHANNLSLTTDHRTEVVQNYPVDKIGTEGHTGLHNYPRFRGSANYQTPFLMDDLKLRLETEHDLEVNDFATEGVNWRPRSMYAGFSFKDAFQLRLGLMTSQWGMGLVANNGLTDPQKNTDLFSDPRSGDRMLRAMAVLPIPTAQSAIILSGDLMTSFQLGEEGPHVVLGDDILLPGDNAQQVVGAWKTNLGKV